MQLALSFSTLLASVLLLLSAADVQAVPVKRSKTITLPLTRIHQNRGDVHPSVLLQQHINRGQRRIARMKGVSPPSKRDLEEAILKRLYIPQNGRPHFKRFNRGGTASHPNSLVEEDEDEADDEDAEDDETSELSALGHKHKTPATDTNEAARKKKGKGGNATAAAAAGTNVVSSSTAAAAAKANLTPASDPTGNNSLGLDIEGSDVGYIATVQMGTPPQDYRLLMDSGSADLWVAGESCQSEGGGTCGPHTTLGTTSSSSFKDSGKAFEVTYGTGHVTGTIVTDDITVAGLTLSAHSFGAAATESTDFSDSSVPFDGLMGLAQSTLSNQQVLTPVESMAKAGLITDAITSYKISRVSDGTNDGEITFGGLDETKFDSATLTTFNNAASGQAAGFWEGAMDAVTVDGTDTGLTGRTAILDTGTTLIIAPTADADAVHKLISGAQSDGQGGFVIPCNTNSTVALSFGGTSFDISTKDLVFAQADNTGTNCISGISSGQIIDATTWLVGDVFLKNAYFSTDVTKNTISLAKLV
ncbi:acid protease [Epithele typhae]|uniref:acid protease n=1 Tax=Epithele typhae TaxID=378194 RepID=UPI00200832AB|nr:acid protease [Epithele typhae]KAH9945288.1 acid protease [Epithele typhae]